MKYPSRRLKVGDLVYHKIMPHLTGVITDIETIEYNHKGSSREKAWVNWYTAEKTVDFVDTVYLKLIL